MPLRRTSAGRAHRAAVALRPAALPAAVAAHGTAGIAAALPAVLRKTAWPRVVVLESAAVLVRLTNRELGDRARDGLALDARELRSDQRAV